MAVRLAFSTDFARSLPDVADAVTLLLDLRPLQGGDLARGIGATVRGLARVLPEAGAILWKDRPRPEEADGRIVHAVRGPCSPGRMSWLVDATRSAASRSGRSRALIHLTNADVSYWGGRPFVVTLNDLIPWRFPELYPAGPTGRLRMAGTVRMIRRASLVVVPSQASAADAERYFGLAPERIRVVPWAADPDWSEPEPAWRDDVCQRLGLLRRYVVMAGGFVHLDPRKRHSDALAALKYLPDDVGLVVTGGPGPAEIQFETDAARLGVESRVMRTGHVTLDEMAAVFSAARVFVFPSLWEGFGLPLLDALTLGVPSVVADGGALPEVAGGAALVFPAGDASALADQVNRILEDSQLAADLSARGRLRSLEFSWDRVGQLYRDVYRECGVEL
jgi:glycosyltransferase involved in cell wall biosynthesis